MDNKFTVEIDGKPVEFAINMPGKEDYREADKVHNRAFADALESKAIVRLKLEKVLRDQGLWDDDRQARLKAVQAEILGLERKICKEGNIKLSEARNLAISMRKKRNELKEILSERTELESMTAEAQADNARFNFLISRCVVYNDSKKLYFKDYADYINQLNTEIAQKAANTLVKLLFGSTDESDLPENKFLKEWGFVDEKLRLVNKDKKLIDEDGRLIDENGRYINEKGEFVDRDGNLVDQEGNYKAKDGPIVFLDDDGNPIVKQVDEPLPANNEEIAKVE
jgi:hypothetical protein